MTIRCSALLVSALALAAFLGPSFADDMKPKAKTHQMSAPAPRQSNWKALSEDFFAGPVNDPGSDNRYFTDTRQPSTQSLGAPIFERWQ